MMGPFSSAVLAGCLNALKWLLWFTAGLVLVAVAAVLLRGETTPSPVALLVVAAGCGVMGWVCGWLARNVTGLPHL